jgi:hypothetical protein
VLGIGASAHGTAGSKQAPTTDSLLRKAAADALQRSSRRKMSGRLPLKSTKTFT